MGGGGIDGRTYTNSLEAWDYAYKRGNRILDVDLSYTIDSVLVARHAWDDNLEERIEESMRSSRTFMDKNGFVQYKMKNSYIEDYASFKKNKIFHLYTPQSIVDMIAYMQEHKDLYVAPDMKADDVVSGYRDLISTARKQSADNILERIIVSIYDYDIYDKVMAIYPFKNVIMRQHYVHPLNYSELTKFCLTHDVHVVNISSCYAEDKGVQMLISKGIKVYVAVVNYISDMREYRQIGFSGCISDFLYEDIYELTSNNEK